MKIPVDPMLPLQGSANYERSLYTRLYDLFRSIATQVNSMAEGKIVSYYSAATSAPSKGNHFKGDFIRNSDPSDMGGYVVIGWICVQSGEPGQWKEARCQTI